MIIVLNEADFSANNIGQIPNVSELSEQTLAILSNATKYPKSKWNDYSQALNTLVNGLVNAGIYDKVSLLTIPVMSKNLTECACNQKTGVSVANTTAFANIYSLESDGSLRRTTTSHKDGENSCYYNISYDYDNVCVFGYYKLLDNTSYPNPIFDLTAGGSYGSSSYVRWPADKAGQVVCGSAFVTTEQYNPFLVGVPVETTPFIVNYESGQVTFKNKRVVRTGTYTNPPTKTDKLVGFYPLTQGYESSARNGSMLIYGCGTKLTSEEMTTLYDLINNFGNKFLV